MPIVLRSNKGSPLTHPEMDTNINELDTRLNIVENWNLTDLNNVDTTGKVDGSILKYDGTDWLVSGVNIVEDLNPQLGGDLDANLFNIDMGTNIITDPKVGEWDIAYSWGDHSLVGYIIGDAGLSYDANSSTLTSVNVTVTGTITADIIQSSGTGTPVIEAAVNLELTAGNAVHITSSVLRLASFTTTERNALAAQNGDMIYNTTDNKFQGYENGAWANLI